MQNNLGPSIEVPELEDWLPMPPGQGPPLPKFLSILWPWFKPTESKFSITDLTITPTEVQINQVVVISFLLTNFGNETGNYTVKLRGDFMAEKTISLAAGESRVVSFEVTPSVAKVHSVSVDGLTGSFMATPAPVANILVEDLVISPSEVFVGEKVTISVTVTNYGAASGSKQIVCTVR